MYVSPVATVVHGDFEWDDAKAETNLAKHGVAFEEAILAMTDPLSLDFEDLVERIISARDATPQERRRYDEAD